MTQIGAPITTAQACWAILKELKTPIVGDLEKYSSVGYALQGLHREEVWNCLSSGEKRLVNIAQGLYGGDENLEGSGVAALGGLDRDLRRRVWIILGYLILGELSHQDWQQWDSEFDFGKYKER